MKRRVDPTHAWDGPEARARERERHASRVQSTNWEEDTDDRRHVVIVRHTAMRPEGAAVRGVAAVVVAALVDALIGMELS